MNNFSVAAVFSDHMVLQRNKFISIFGQADDGLKIKVKLFDKNHNLLSENENSAINGRWLVQLDAQAAQNGCFLQITADDSSIEFSDIAIGEVWLAGGQSNMEFELQNCTEGPAELALGSEICSGSGQNSCSAAAKGKTSAVGSSPETKKIPNVRFYYTNKIAWKDDNFYKAEKQTCWQTWDSEWKKAWSAVGYFFAKKLSEDLGCTVGVIGCNWGGTSASAWMRKEFLEKDEDLRTYLTEQEEATKGKSIEQQCKEYDDYTVENDAWQIKCNALYQAEPTITWAQVQKRIGQCKWPGPKSCKNPYRPTGLYDCMLSRIMPYTVKGVLWYQGESDDHKPQMYAKLFSTMIDNWRTDWGDDSLPFIFVQLPEHRYEQDKDFKNWCLIREAQAKVHKTVKNAFMTCALDLGQYNDIHPKAKKVLAERMEKNALANVYDLLPEGEAMSPMFEAAFVQGNDVNGNGTENENCTDDGAENSLAGSKSGTKGKNGTITISLKYADDGLEFRDDQKELAEYKKLEAIQNQTVPEDFTGFEVAGRDGVYYPATFAFGGTDGKRNLIILSSKKVPEPFFARYAWYNYGPVTIYGKNGLPLAPFRTSPDDTKEKIAHAEIQQIMEV